MPRLTFDNLGEAADLERGLRPPDAPVGDHPSVTVALPRLLAELASLDLRATFFVEGWSAAVYPDALRAIAAGGHELGLHGWRHEAWSELDPEREDALLRRGRGALAQAGIDVRAFRPPGGRPTAATPRLLREHGFSRWSPVAGSVDRPDAGLPADVFEWQHVDAFHRLESFTEARGGPPLTPSETAARLCAAPEGATLVLHPFLMIDDAGWDGARRVLAHVATTTAGRSA